MFSQQIYLFVYIYIYIRIKNKIISSQKFHYIVAYIFFDFSISEAMFKLVPKF